MFYIQRSGVVVEKGHQYKEYGENWKWDETRYMYEHDGDPVEAGELLFPFKLTRKKCTMYVQGRTEKCHEEKTVRVWLGNDEMDKLYSNPKDFIEYVIDHDLKSTIRTSDISYDAYYKKQSDVSKEENNDDT